MASKAWWKIRSTKDGNQACRVCGDFMGDQDPDNPYCWKTASPIDVSLPGKPLECFTAMPSDVPEEKVFDLLMEDEL